MLFGQWIVGPAVSLTAIVNVHMLEFGGAAWSVAVQVTVVVPSGKTLPEGGAQPNIGEASHASVAVVV